MVVGESQSKARAIVAIITRTKNRPVLLKRALESIVEQTSKEYVHIVLNDGGDQMIFQEIIASVPDKRRIVLNNKASAGLIPALNQAIRASDSEYVCILDDDDSWHPQRLETVIDYIKKSPTTQACVVKMDVVVEDIIDGKIVRVDQYLHPDSGDGEISLYKQCARNYISNGIVTYSRKVYEELGGYDESLETAEDWDFGIRLLMKYDVDLIQTEQPLFYYHQRPDQKGDDGNSVHAGVRTQEVTINRIRNKYLREDIAKGVLGVGYIMNQTVADVSHIIRLEGHINQSEKHIADKIDHMGGVLRQTHDKLLRTTIGRVVEKSRVYKLIKKEKP